jgi:hypothetical protein
MTGPATRGIPVPARRIFGGRARGRTAQQAKRQLGVARPEAYPVALR